MTSTNPGGQSGPARPVSPPPLASRRSRQGLSLVAVLAAFALLFYLLNGGVATSQNSGGTPAASPMASPQADDPRITIDFTELNDSGVTGSATLFAAGNTTIVEIDLDGTGEDHPAHIHAGTCDDIQPEPEFNLQNVGEAGTSTSTVDLPLAELIDGDYVIDLHLAANQLGTLIVCGDIDGTPANAAGTPVAIGGQVDPTAPPAPTATATATVEPTALPTTAPTELPAPTATLVPTQEPTVAPTQEPTVAPASTPDDTADAIGGAISEITGGDGTQGSSSMLDLNSGKGASVASNGGVGGNTSGSGDGTEGGSATQSGKGGPIASTTGTLAATGTGSSLLLPQTPYEAAMTASGVFSVILFGAAMMLRRRETRAAASRWRRLGL